MEIRDAPSLCHGTKRNFRTMTMKELESCIEAYGKDIYNFCLHLTKETEQAEERRDSGNQAEYRTGSGNGWQDQPHSGRNHLCPEWTE